MEEDELLNREQVEKRLSPHPLSFMGLQSLCIFLIVWGLVFGWLVNFSDFRGLLSNSLLQIAVWGLVILVVSIIASIIKVLWRIFFLYLAVVLVAMGLIYWLNLFDVVGLFLPVYTVVASIIGFLLVEWFRRSHKYIISNQRIVFKGGVVTKEQRTLRYDKISDVNTKQGILGQIFGFGTIIPISQSGFGLGSDQSFAGGGAQAAGTKKVGFFGFFGGGREVQTPRTRSYYELHGVYPFKEIRKIVEQLVQGSEISQYQKQQVEYQEEQRDFQQEQRDLQKEMKDLLKKQKEMSKTNDE
jgi:membrane protein YdbS with pleckstrin-like domain